MFWKPRTRPTNHLISLGPAASFEAEQYRRLRQRVEAMTFARHVRVIAVASAVAGEGKTLTAINLAGALARSRAGRVLLVDADLRQPAVGRQLGLETERGLARLLSRNDDRVADAVRPVDGLPLDVIPAEQSRLDSYELLSGPRLGEVLREARTQYSYVIVDTPPLIPVPDTSLLGRVVDGFLMVISANGTPRRLVGEALNLLEPSSVLGIVLNRDDRPLFGYYHAYYRRYFDGYLRSAQGNTA